MSSFQGIWTLLKPEGEYKRRYRACDRLWTSYAPEMRQRIYDALLAAQQRGDPISPNPYFAIEDTALRLQRQPRLRQLSFNEYYAKYGTTEERDGWKMENPTGNKVIYVKAG